MADLTEQQLLTTDPEILGLQRQRQLANLLTGQAFNQPQGQMISGHYVKPSNLQQALPMINAAIGGLTNANLDTKQTELAAALRGKQQEVVQQFANAKTPQQRLAAVTSQYAPAFLQKSAAEMFTPRTLKKGEVFGMQNPVTGKFEQMGSGMPELPSAMESAQVALGLPKNPEEWTPQERQAAMNYEFSLKTAGANRTSVNVSNQLPFKEQIQKGMAEDLVKNYGNLKNAPTEIKNLDKVVELAKSPAYLGSGAEAKLAITKFFNNNLGTNVNADKVVNTEEMRSALFQSTMENLKKVDAQPSQMQQQIMQQAFGTIGTDPAAIPKIVAVYKDILTNKVMEHNARVSESETGPAKIEYPYNIKIQLPTENKAPVNGAFPNVDMRSIDAILQSRGVR